MAEFRLESGILGVRWPAFCFPFVATPFQHPTPNAGALNTRNHRIRGCDRRKPKTGPEILKNPDYSRISAILPIRGVPGDVRREADIRNAQREGAKYAKPPQMGWRHKKNQRPGRKSPKFRTLVAIPPFYRSVSLRWDQRGVP